MLCVAADKTIKVYSDQLNVSRLVCKCAQQPSVCLATCMVSFYSAQTQLYKSEPIEMYKSLVKYTENIFIEHTAENCTNKTITVYLYKSGFIQTLCLSQ